jgi:hypothetical protein
MSETEDFYDSLKKTVIEIHEIEAEWVIIHREDLFRDDWDLANFGRIQNGLKEIQRKFINGECEEHQAMNDVRLFFNVHHSLVSRLTESRQFPELYALWQLCQ